MSDPKITALLIGTVLSLVSAIVFLYMRGEQIHRKYSDMANQNLLKMTEAMLGNKAALENNTDINKEVKDLIHTVNTNILEIKFNGIPKKK